MAQLSDDCFAFGGPMMSVDEATALIASRITPVSETELAELANVDGRVLAGDLLAPLPLPPFTNSAVDGYAIHSRDLPADRERAFPVIGRVAAGAAAVSNRDGEAVRIFTGAPMPASADTVFMQEDVRLDPSGHVVLPAGLKPGANVRPAGEDMAVGQVALPSGRWIRPQDVALIAALGVTEVKVRRRVRVAIFSTGNEVVAPGATRGPAQLYDSNRFMLRAMLMRLGCEVSDFGILRDDPAVLAATLKEAAAGHDLIVTSGGVSTGEEDHVKTAVERAGSLTLWRMAIKPGRPVAMGVIPGSGPATSAAFIGLPGNPVASFVTFTYVVRPAVLALAGTTPERLAPTPVMAAFSYKKKAGRREYVRATVRRSANGAIEAVKFPREGAGLLSSLVDTDGLVELPEDATRIEPGQTVAFFPYAVLL